jgi:hypothetical protein
MAAHTLRVAGFGFRVLGLGLRAHLARRRKDALARVRKLSNRYVTVVETIKDPSADVGHPALLEQRSLGPSTRALLHEERRAPLGFRARGLV